MEALPGRTAALGRARRDPAGPYRITCVCHGNICRSAMAEAVLRDQLERAGLAGRVTVDSAGTAAEVGQPMDVRAVVLMFRRRYGLEPHQARQWDPSWLAGRDLVLAMDEHNLAALRGLGPLTTAGTDRIRLFGEAAGLGGADVPNPYYSTETGFAIVLAMLETGMAAIVSQLAATIAEGTTP